MSWSRRTRITGISIVDDAIARLLEMFGLVALLAIMVPAVFVILVVSFVLSVGLGMALGLVVGLAGIPNDVTGMIAGSVGIGGGLGLTLAGTVKLYRRLERVVNLLTSGEWKTDDEIRSETEQASLAARRSALSAADLAELDSRLAPPSPQRLPKAARQRRRR